MKATCYAVLALLVAVSAITKEDRTITKVVKLLQDMMVKSKDEGDTERTIYGKFKCYCDTNDEEKTVSIASLEKQIDLLGSAIDSLQSQNGELSGQTAKLKEDMASNEAGRKEATNVRDKSNKAFLGEEADLKAAVGQMAEAIKVLSAIGGDQTLANAGRDHEKFMAGHKVKSPLLVALGAEVKNALAAASIFLNSEQKQVVGSFLQGPKFTGSYSAQSGQIVGILKDMRATFQTNLEDAVATEAKAKSAFDKFMKVNAEAFVSMEKVYKEKQDTLSANDEALTSKKKQLQAAQVEKTQSEDFLEKLTVMCAEKAKEYDQRNLLRANEEAAISQAISILKSDSAFETFGGVSATSSGKVKAASFLQLGLRRSEAAIRGELSQLLSAEKSARLARVLATVEAGNPFETVLVEIEKMKNLNAAEGKEDKKNLDFCTSERKENGDNLKDREADILTLSTDIDKLDTSIHDPVKGLNNQIKLTEASLVQNNEAQVSQTKQRTEENVAYQADVRNLVDAEDLLSKAISILTAYYDGLAKRIAGGGAAAMVQKDPAPPDTWDTYSGQSSKGGDAVSMLQYILSETQKEQTEAHSDEEKGQADYEDSMAALKAEQAKSEGSLVKLNEDLATAEKTLIEKQEDLKDAETTKAKIEAYLLNIKPGCDFITTNFELREKNRKTETTALTKAVKMIKETPAYKAAAQDAKEASFGNCKAPCLKSEAGAKCKACMAKVTVPAYCAGHRGTPGC